MIRRLAAALLAVVISGPHARAQQAAPVPGSELTVYLLTMGPGDEVWEKFGHNAIWIHNDSQHSDVAYHWGLFDFSDKDFVPRFIQGRMRYSMGAFDLEQTLAQYRLTNRTVWAQKLNLTPGEKERLQEFVWWNVRPENRFYRYDYFRDNCSTRTRDAIDRILGGLIERATDSVRTRTTFRSHTARLTQDDWPVFTGTMMGLGSPTDREISAYEEMFLPVRMMKQLRSVRVPSPAGLVPLVENESVLFQATRAPEPEQVNRGIAGYLVIAVIVIATGAVLFIYGIRTRKLAGFLGFAGLWSFIAGLAGILLGFLWAFTDHVYSYRNENLLQLNPLSVIAGVMIFALIFKRRSPSATRPSRSLQWVVVAAAALSFIGFALQVLPSFDQANGWVIALALPIHVAVAAAIISLRSLPASPLGDE